MTKSEIRLELDILYKSLTPDGLDPTLKVIFRIAMNQAFILGVKNTATDENFKKNALEIIYDWENQFNFI